MTAPFLDGLNDDQRAATLHEGSPLAVLAGPGSGKTRVIVHRVHRLVAPIGEGGSGAAPESVVALAFTVKSAEELRNRLATRLGFSVAAQTRIMTSHAFGRTIVRRFADRLGVSPDAQIMDTAQRRRLLRRIIDDLDLFADYAGVGRESAIPVVIEHIEAASHDAVSPARLLAYVEERRSALENAQTDLDELAVAAARAELHTLHQCALAYEAFEERRLAESLLTLDDYIALPIRLLEERQDVADILRSEVRHVVVDEFQDWNPAQIRLLSLLAPPHLNPDVCVVGDDDQAIYAFRGADDRAFERFGGIYPEHAVIRLATNYRSSPVVIEGAQGIITRANARFDPEKAIEANPARPAGDPEKVEGVLVEDDGDQGAVIAAMILADRAANPGREWRDYAVVARTNAFLDQIASDLEVADIPVGPPPKRSPLDDPSVQDLLAWARILARRDTRSDTRRLLVRPPALLPLEDVAQLERDFDRTLDGATEEPGDFLAHLRAHASGVPAVADMLGRIDLLGRIAVEGAPPDKVLAETIRECALASVDAPHARERARRIEALARVLRFAGSCAPRLPAPADLASFLDYYADLDEREQAFETVGDEAVDRDPDDPANTPDAVQIVSAHRAKGLEFDTVFIARAAAPHGFPQSRADDRLRLPAELTGRAALDRADEERRLFYVALTRAERRAVLLRKAQKSRPSAVSFYHELLDDGLMVESDAQEYLDRANLRLPDELTGVLEGIGSNEAADRWIERESARVRAESAAALIVAERAGDDADRLSKLQASLTHAISQLNALAHLRSTGALPASADPKDPLLKRAVEVASGAAQPGSAFSRRLPPPLSLSYTFVKSYLDCPRCFYIANVLGLREPPSPHMLLGSVVHEALEEHFQAAASAENEGGAPPTPAQAQERAMRIYDRRRGLRAARDPDVASKISAQIDAALRMHDGAQILEVEQFHRFPYRLGDHEHRFTGRIDRLDQLTDGSLRIVDYKTGASRKYLTEPSKDDLQLSIYALALMHQQGADDPPPGVAEYWVLSTGERGSIPLTSLRLDKAREKINEAIEGILAGRFDEQGRSCNGRCGLFC